MLRLLRPRSRTGRTPVAPRTRRAYVLLISMGLLGLLAMLGTTFVLISRSEQSITSSYVDGVRARMIAFSGMEHAIGTLMGYDRIHPWSGQFWYGGYTGTAPINRNIGTHGVKAIGDGSIKGTNRGWGDDDWLYGELAKPVTGASPSLPGPTRAYGAPIPQPGRRILGGSTDAARHVSLPALDPATLEPAVANVGGMMMGYSSDRDVIRGTYVSQPDNPGDFYMTKILDAAARIYVNDTNRNGRLERMLNTLGDELSPKIANLGKKLRPGGGSEDALFSLKDPYDDEVELKARSGLTDDQIDQIRDFVTFRAWADPNVIKIPFDGVSVADPVESRAPININSAPKEVLVAVLNGIAGSYETREVKGPKKTALAIDLGKARALADHIIACRYLYKADPSRPIGYPHVDWMHVYQDTIDTAPMLSQEEADLIKAAINPNTTIKKWNPDLILVDPDVTGRTDFTLLDKTDVTVLNTEFCFGSMGYYDIEVTAIISEPSRTILASHTVRTTVKTYDVLRLSTQEQFEKHRIFNEGAYSTEALEQIAPSPYNTRLVSIITLPEYPFERAYSPASGVTAPWGGAAPGADGPARYDGQLYLNGWVDHRAVKGGGGFSVLAGFGNRKFDAGEPPPSNAVVPMSPGNMLDPSKPMLTVAPNFWETQMHPFGAYFDPHKLSGKYIEYPVAKMPGGNSGTVELWFKPMVDLVGLSGWEKRDMYLMGSGWRVDEDYFLVKIKFRQLQVVLSKADDAGASNVVLTHDLTTGIGPKAWLPHTWHHIEFNWNEAGGTAEGTAMLFVDGDYSADKSKSKVTIPAGFNFKPNTPRTTPFGGLDGDVIVGNSTIPSSSHDPGMSPDLGAFGTIDNVCFHPKMLHAGPFPSRSRYHDISVRSGQWNYTSLTGRSDTTGNHGIYRRRLEEVLDRVAEIGPATLLTLSCTHYHAPHEHSTGSHDGPAWTPGSTTDGTALGHVSIAIERDNLQFNFQYDNCAGTPAFDTGTSTWITINPTQDLRLVVKMEISETSMLPHNVGPIVDDVTITYTTGPKILTMVQPIW